MPNADGNIKANKVLEINAKHEILDKLNKTYLEDKEKLSHYVTVLYNGARLLEGLKIEDTLGFVDAISKII